MSKTIEKLEALKQRLENQIEETMNTIIAIQELEQKEPWRPLSDWHQVWASMIFYNILTQSCFETKLKWLTSAQAGKYIEEIWEMTHEHYKNLYGWDSKKLN